MTRAFGSLWRNLQIYQVFGANTNVGKTIFSTLLCSAARRRRKAEDVWYLKPVSTGPLSEADDGHLARYAKGTKSQKLFQFNDPTSPHLAARAAGSQLSDQDLLSRVASQIQSNAQTGPGFMLLETAGGPNSPAPSGTLQADLYRPFRLPIIFIADPNLGGISTSISAYESLKLHGYDIAGVGVLRDSYYKNFDFFKRYFGDRQIPLLTAQLPPDRDAADDALAMEQYYAKEDSGELLSFLDTLARDHESRISDLENMSTEGLKHIWWPFTQHQHLTPGTITTIDSAFGDYFQTVPGASSVEASNDSNDTLLQSTLDGSASWWTQGLGHANPDLTMAAAYAAGRYGHVMFASAINEPALALAGNLLGMVGNPRLSRCFFSDNGSTGMEVGVKMGLKAACDRYGWDPANDGQPVEILGMQNSYHGDTLGAMDMSEPSVFNKKIHWYSGRGFWFDSPTVKMRDGVWMVEKPVGMGDELGTNTKFQSLQQIFDQSRDMTDEAATYENYIRSTLERLTQHEKRRFGALVMEPVVLGAGGMLLLDPLYQRTLVNVVRHSQPTFAPKADSNIRDSSHPQWTGLPIVADEVFTGLYRLGHASSSHLLGLNPDIAAYAKLLTGGLVPLSCTLASESIFNAFLAEGKSDALLHGHSYTAHPIGCNVANTSLDLLKKLETDGKWDSFKQDWNAVPTSSTSVGDGVRGVAAAATGASLDQIQPDPNSSSTATPAIYSVWSTSFLDQISRLTHRVDSVWALGSVLSISLKDAEGGGYTSNAAKSLQFQLLEGDAQGWNIHSRVLGNVLYLMTAQTSEVADVRAWEDYVKAALKL